MNIIYQDIPITICKNYIMDGTNTKEDCIFGLFFVICIINYWIRLNLFIIRIVTNIGKKSAEHFGIKIFHYCNINS